VSDDLKRAATNLRSEGWDDEAAAVDAAADRIEKLELRTLLLEGFLDGALNVIEKFVHCDTQEARKALEGRND